MKRKPEVVLIDGRNFVYRHGFTRSGLSSKGRPSGAIFGVLHGLTRMSRLFPGAAVVICWDGIDASKSWRHKICPSYKSNRVTDKTKVIPKPVLDIRNQIPVIEQLFKDFGLKQFSVPRLEADDLIGVLATSLSKTHHKIHIYSTDRDFYQLIKDNVCVVRDIDKSKKGLEITAKEIKREYGVSPKNWLKYRAFVGDSGDRIDKPIKGIGPKKALAILAAGVDASQPKAHPQYKKDWKAIRLAYKLSKIVRRPESKLIPKQAAKALRRIIKESDLFRDKDIATSRKHYKRFVKFLVDYDLEQILEHRNTLWSIK